MRTLGFGILVGSIIVLTACGGAKKRAGEFMEKGLFDDAIRTYEEVLKKDPNDTEAAAGLRNARFAWMDSRLIEVRMARMAGSNDKALDQLLEVSGRQTQWKTQAGGKVAFTQNEEILYGMGHAEKVAVDSAAQKLPLKGEHFLLKYRPLFESGDMANRYAAARARTKAAGETSCQSFLPAVKLATKHPYHYRFVRSYCDYWGVSTPEPPKAAEKFHESYIGKFSASALGVTNLPADVRVYLADTAKAAFERTAWYDAGGTQGLDLVVGGGYTYAESRVSRPLQHVYSVQEPYTEYVDVQKSRSVAYKALEGVFDPLSKTTQQKEITKYRNETYTEKEPQTRYRDVQRTHYYQGWQRDRKITLGLSAQLAVEKRPLQLELAEVSQSGGIESDENQPSIGLKPQHPALQDPPQWLRHQSDRFVSQFEQKLAGLWREVHCQGTGVEDIAISGDVVQKCLRQKLSETPAFADAWYQKNVGVSAREAASILGLGDRK